MSFRPAVWSALACALPVAWLHAQEHVHPRKKTSATAAVAASKPPGPAVLVNESRTPRTVEVTITAEPTLLSIVPGVKTTAYAYNGRVPGPTLEAYEGDRVIVHFHNRLPEPTTIHWHGMHLPAKFDGSPFYMVQPGESYDYEFMLEKGTAGTYWYHPHPHPFTGAQVAKGLFAPLIVRAHDDPLPKSITERLIVLSDNRFRADGSIDIADPSTPQGNLDVSNGREGNILFVNGQVMPTISIRSGEVQRWRVINASAARVYKLALHGHTFLHVGSDGGLFERPVEVNDLILANGERAELLVRGTGAPGARVTLQALPYDRYVPQTRPNDWNQPRDLLAVQYTPDAPVARVTLPNVLRHVPALDTARVSATRVMALSQG